MREPASSIPASGSCLSSCLDFLNDGLYLVG